MVWSVAEGRPAEQAGLLECDVITDIRDKELIDEADFYKKVITAIT